jgi:hypothetical protein
MNLKLTVAPYDFRKISLLGSMEIRDKSDVFLCLYIPIFGYARGANVIVSLSNI